MLMKLICLTPSPMFVGTQLHVPVYFKQFSHGHLIKGGIIVIALWCPSLATAAVLLMTTARHLHQHPDLFPACTFWHMIHWHVEKAVGSLWDSLNLQGEKNACAPSVCNTSKMPRCLNDALSGMIKTARLKCKISLCNGWVGEGALTQTAILGKNKGKN